MSHPSPCVQPLAFAPSLQAGGLVQAGVQLEAAVQRYWAMWLPLLAEHQACPKRASKAHMLSPPLDVAWCWFVHRLNPTLYNANCTARHGRELHPLDAQQTLGFSGGTGSAEGDYTRQVSRAAWV